MRKKTVLAIILMLSLCITGAAITGCAPQKPGYMFVPYTRYEEQVTTPTTDIATLDGKFDEQIWSGVTWHNMTSTERNRTGANAGLSGFSTDVAYSATAVTSEKGLYVGIKSEDPVLYVGSKWDDFNRKSQQVPQSAFAKTGASIYVGGNAVKWNKGVVEIGFAIDGEISANYWTSGNKSSKLGTIGMLSGVDLKGAQLNVQDGEGYAIEAFVPWTALPFFDAKPETVRATYASHRYADFDLEEITSVKRCWEMLDSGNGHQWVTPTGWYVYGDAGRIVQQGSETFGMGNGVLEYDSGFDLSLDKASEGANRKVTFTAPTAKSEVRQARLYVKDLKDTVMYAKAKFTVDTAALGGVLNNIDAYPMAGLTFLGADKVNGKMGVVNMGVTLAKDAALNNPPYFNSRYSAVTTDTQNFVGARKYYTSDPFDPTTADGFTLAVYRDGTQFYLICNGVHYATVQIDFITASTETFIALTTVNLPVTVSEYTFACGADVAGTVNITPTLAYTDGKAVDAKLSLQGAQLTFTNKADPTVTYSATVGTDNAVSTIADMKVGTYTVTTTAMGGNLKVHDFVCVGDGNATGVLRLRLNNAIGGNGTYQASIDGNGLSINALKEGSGNRPSGHMLLEGISLTGENWFGGTVRLSGGGASLNYGSVIGFSFLSDGGLTSIQIGHVDGADAGTAGVRFRADDGNYRGATYTLNAGELDALKSENGVQVAICRTASDELKIYFNGTLSKTIAASDHTIRGAITGFGARLNTLNDTADNSTNAWIHNINYYTSVKTLNTSVQLKYTDGKAVDAAKLSLQGKQFTFTNKADPNTTYTVTVGADNAIPAIPNMKMGAYTVTTTAMGGKLKVKDFACVGAGNTATGMLCLRLNDAINTSGSNSGTFSATIDDNGLSINVLKNGSGKNSPAGYMLLEGISLTGENWFGGTVRLSGDGASLNYGSMIGFSFVSNNGLTSIQIGHISEDGNAKPANTGWVRFYDSDGADKGFKGQEYAMKSDEVAALRSADGVQVAICRTASGDLQVYFNGVLATTFTASDNTVGTDTITGFGVHLNTLNDTDNNSTNAWIHNVNYATAETLNTTVQLKYANGNAIDASKVSFQGAQFTFTNKADSNTTYNVTVGANNVIPAIANMKVGTYTVTTTAMGGNLKVNDFVCVGDGNATCTLGLQLTNEINTKDGSYKAELGNGFTVNNIVGNRPSGNLFMTGLNLTGETWFGGTIRLSGDANSLNYGSMIGLYFKTATIDRWIEFYGELDKGNIIGVRFRNTTTNSYESTTYTMTTDEQNALKSQNGLRVAVCRTAGGKLEVYLVIGETLGTKVVEFDLGTEAITGFGVRLNTINTGAADNGAAWIKNVQFGTQAEILGA